MQTKAATEENWRPADWTQSVSGLLERAVKFSSMRGWTRAKYTTDADTSLSMETSPFTKQNFRIYETPTYQTLDLNSDV
jgi:hypothetical protein